MAWRSGRRPEQVTNPIGIEQAVDPDRGDTLTTGRLALLASLAALGALATNIMLPAFPAMALELGVLPRELAWTLSSFFIVFAVGQLFVGPLSDTVGRAPFVLGGLAVFVVGSIVCVVAPSLPVLIAGRAIQALGACAASVLARAIARDLYHGAELTRALALVMIAMAAAPGFSPALGTGMTLAFGWRSTFVLVAAAGVLVALHYRLSAGETLPLQRRRPAHPVAIARTYRDLVLDARFISPALTVSLIIGCLYSFFGAAPAILITDMGLSGTGLSIFFAATVLVVFGSGLLTGRLVVRWGAPRVGMAGLLIATAGGLWLLLQNGAAAPAPFMAAVTLFLAGMGLVNPVGTAIALEPFGDRAGIASALLGFLQMSCAAIGTALIGVLPVSAASAYAWVVFGGTLLAVGAFVSALTQQNRRVAVPVKTDGS
jgi:DHA1 family bicyclomycin/chloramphenicol resistance-like MFS transporter